MDINDILKDLERNVVGDLEEGSSSGRNSKGFSNEGKRLMKLKAEESSALQQAWISERMAPELLPYKDVLITSILNRLKSQIEIIELNSIELETNNQDIKLKLLIIENEIERINFLLRSYLRCRLSKIEEFGIYLNKKSQNGEIKLDEIMSKLELKFMNGHLKILLQLYEKLFINQLPQHLQSVDDESGGISMITSPDQNKFVFVKVLKDNVKPVRLGELEIMLDKNDIHALQYKIIKKHIDRGDVILI